MANRVATVRKIGSLRKRVASWRAKGDSVALIPTMGSLHEGHVSLVRFAQSKANRVIVSIFVNPTQFGPNEDFKSYPRTEASDRKALSGVGADMIFAPSVAEMYADDFSTQVNVSGLTDCLCGASRPHHFTGVATVVAKLLLQALPDIAIFGEKDYQQLLVIKRMVRDLDIPARIMGAPTVRESDGLALSSRNVFLNRAQRQIAPLLRRTLVDAADDIAAGRAVNGALKAGRACLEAGGFRVDYLEARRVSDLAPMTRTDGGPARVFAAAFLGKTRLIDNAPVPKTAKNRRRGSQ
jgi:pantoate--beta-alanine ligase